MTMKELKLTITPLQKKFIDSPASITLFGGAAGGGKSYGLLLKHFLYCMRYPGAKCLLLRKTFPELKRSLILTSLELIPRELGKYNDAEKVWRFVNGSRLEFGYCERETDVTKYQSAEYDRIGFDESTHFTEYQFRYMLSRNRGANDYPKGMDLATNPGNVGHAWHKSVFIDPHPPFTVWEDEYGLTYTFIPARVTDNPYLMAKDPDYIRRLQQLPEDERRALMDGDWDVFAGQYFACWRREIHVVQPFEIPEHWRLFRSVDYGLDMTACYWWAADQMGRCYIYRELYQPDLTLSQAARKIVEMTPEEERGRIEYTVVSPDLWNRRQDTGKSGVETFIENGVDGLLKADHRRVPGWFQLQEFLMPFQNEFGEPDAYLKVFSTCTNLIRTLPALVRSERNPNDVDENCEDHAPESVRYGVMSRPAPARPTDHRRVELERRFEKGSPEYRIWSQYLDDEAGHDSSGIDPSELV